jgi:ADP-heptose:LPS heptosyltransferase
MQATSLDGINVRRILVCLRWGIGDVVMSMSSLRAVRRRWPKAQIVGLGAAPALDVLAAGDVVDSVQDVAALGVEHWGDVSDRAKAGATRWLQEQLRFDIVIDSWHAASAVSEAISLKELPTLEGFQPLQHELTRNGMSITEAQSVSDGAGWGIEVEHPKSPKITLRARDEAWGERLAFDWDVAPAAIVPAASTFLKQWPAERFAAVADVLAKRDGRVVMFRGPDEALGEAVRRQMELPERVVEIGPEHLLRQAALLKRCRQVVTNDTGLMHLAASVGTPVLGLFGPTSGKLLTPPLAGSTFLGDASDCPHHRVDELHMPACWGASKCLHGESRSCIDRIATSQVVELVTHRNGLEPDDAAGGVVGNAAAV